MLECTQELGCRHTTLNFQCNTLNLWCMRQTTAKGSIVFSYGEGQEGASSSSYCSSIRVSALFR
jgi:hypothetical protein